MIQIVDHRKLVIENQPIQQFIVDRLPGHHDRYFGTLDKALQRFNTILIKLSQEPLDLSWWHAKQVWERLENLYGVLL